MKRVVTCVLAVLLLLSLLGGCVKSEEEYKTAIYRHVSQKHHGTNMLITAISTGKNTRYVQIEPDGSARATVMFDVQNAIGMTLHMSSVIRLNGDLEVTSCDFCGTFGIETASEPGWTMGSDASEKTEPEESGNEPGWTMGSDEPEETEPPATEPQDPSQTFMVNQELLEVSGMTYGELRARYGEPQIQDQAAQEEDTGIWVGDTVVFPGAPGSGFYFDLYSIWFDCLDDQSKSRGVFAQIGEIFPNYGDGYTLAELRELLPSSRIMFTEVAGGDGDFRYYADRRPLVIGLDGYSVMIAVGMDEDDSFFVGPQTMAKLS